MQSTPLANRLVTLKTLEKVSKDEVVQLAEKIADATKKLGDFEILETLLAKAQMCCPVGDKEVTLYAFTVANEKPQPTNQPTHQPEDSRLAYPNQTLFQWPTIGKRADLSCDFID